MGGRGLPAQPIRRIALIEAGASRPADQNPHRLHPILAEDRVTEGRYWFYQDGSMGHEPPWFLISLV
jgi:hypothetical protein